MNKSNPTIKTSLRFYGDLNDLLTIHSQGGIVERILPGQTSVKDLIEGCGVPHTEVDLILVNGNRVDFSYLVQGEEWISVYPFISSMGIPASERLQEQDIQPMRFLADVNLGKLARYLRLAGFDTAYSNDAKDDQLIEQMLEEERVLLTRDRKLLMYKSVKHGYLPRSDDPAVQLEEVLIRFNLKDQIQSFTRCPNCNGLLEHVEKDEILHKLEPLTKKHYDHFSQCPECGQIYWEGSHRKRLDPRVRKSLNITGEVEH